MLGFELQLALRLEVYINTTLCHLQVRQTAAIEVVTQAQRMLFLQAAQRHMAAQGITYTCQPGENRIRLYQGSWRG